MWVLVSASAWCVHISVSIYCCCQSQLIVSLLLPSPSFLLGPIICWLPSNWLRAVFGNGAVCRDFGVCRGSSGLGPLGTDGHLRTIPQRMLFSLCGSVDLYFSPDRFAFCSSSTPCHTGIHVIIDLAPCPQQSAWFWENPFFGGLYYHSCKIQCL